MKQNFSFTPDEANQLLKILENEASRNALKIANGKFSSVDRAVLMFENWKTNNLIQNFKTQNSKEINFNAALQNELLGIEKTTQNNALDEAWANLWN